jgi:hypothetical protein
LLRRSPPFLPAHPGRLDTGLHEARQRTDWRVYRRVIRFWIATPHLEKNSDEVVAQPGDGLLNDAAGTAPAGTNFRSGLRIGGSAASARRRIFGQNRGKRRGPAVRVNPGDPNAQIAFKTPRGLVTRAAIRDPNTAKSRVPLYHARIRLEPADAVELQGTLSDPSAAGFAGPSSAAP